MRRCERDGFTLVELMVAVAIAGLLSATAIPAFAGFVRRSKTSEITSNLNSMFKLAAAYYNSERSEQGEAAGATGNCVVGDAGPLPATPLPQKQAFSADPNFQALGFSLADYTYFSYGMAAQNPLGGCAHAPNTPDLYTFYANGDLDGDTVLSTFEISAGSNANNVLYHGRAFFIDQELE